MPSDSNLELLDELGTEYLDRKQRGECPTVSEYCARYPQMADAIRKFLKTLNLADELSNSSDSALPALQQVQPTLDRLGDYRIVREIGRGGMGIVYEAIQESLQRRVALKVLPHRWLKGQDALARFDREARETAKLHHSNIVPVYETGAQEGHLFYAMQLVSGRNLSSIISQLRSVVADGNPKRSEVTSASNATATVLPDDQIDGTAPSGRSPLLQTLTARPDRYVAIAEIGLSAADAIDYTHQRGVIHRDIKPSNLIIDDESVVWVTDFGLVKTDDEDLTQTGDYLGTLRYMAPERFRGECNRSCDIYALGLTLYELVALRPPFEETDHMSLIESILRDPPPRLRTMDPSVPIDLETIIYKAIEKDPDARYSSASELADDLRNFIDDRPIIARRPTMIDQFCRWRRNNQKLAATLVTAIVLGSALLIGSVIAAAVYRGQREEQFRLASARAEEATRARRAEEAVQRRLYGAHMRLAADVLWESGGIGRVLDFTDRWVPEIGKTDLRGWEWYFLRSYAGHEVLDLRVTDGAAVQSVDWSPDGRRVATTSARQSILVWDAQTGELLLTLDAGSRVACVRWSPEGQRIASADGRNASIWNLDSAQRSVQYAQPATCRSIAWNPDGGRIATVAEGEGSIAILDAERGELIATLQHDADDFASMDWSPDGKLLAAGTVAGRARVWEVASGDFKIGFDEIGAGELESLSWSPSGDRLAGVDDQHSLFVWDANDGTRIATYYSQANLHSVDWHPDGERIAIASWDGSIRVLDANRLWDRHVLYGHRAQVWEVRWNRQGTHLASSSSDGHVRIWSSDLSQTDVSRVLAKDNDALGLVRWSSDGDQLAALSLRRILHVWTRFEKGFKPLKLHSQVTCFAWRPGATQLAIATQDGNLSLYGAEARRHPIHAIAAVPHESTETVTAMSWSPQGSSLAFVRQGRVWVWDVDGGEQRCWAGDRWASHVAWSPNGQQLAIVGANLEIQICDRNGQFVRKLQGHERAIRDVRWNQAGTKLVSAGLDRSIRIWDVTTGQQEAQMLGHTRTIQSVCWSPDGSRVTSASRDRTLRIWDSATGDELLKIRGHEDAVSSIDWSSDGNRIVSTSEDGTIRIWNAAKASRVDAR